MVSAASSQAIAAFVTPGFAPRQGLRPMRE